MLRLTVWGKAKEQRQVLPIKSARMRAGPLACGITTRTGYGWSTLVSKSPRGGDDISTLKRYGQSVLFKIWTVGILGENSARLRLGDYLPTQRRREPLSQPSQRKE